MNIKYALKRDRVKFIRNLKDKDKNIWRIAIIFRPRDKTQKIRELAFDLESILEPDLYWTIRDLLRSAWLGTLNIEDFMARSGISNKKDAYPVLKKNYQIHLLMKTLIGNKKYNEYINDSY